MLITVKFCSVVSLTTTPRWLSKRSGLAVNDGNDDTIQLLTSIVCSKHFTLGLHCQLDFTPKVRSLQPEVCVSH